MQKSYHLFEWRLTGWLIYRRSTVHFRLHLQNKNTCGSVCVPLNCRNTRAAQRSSFLCTWKLIFQIFESFWKFPQLGKISPPHQWQQTERWKTQTTLVCQQWDKPQNHNHKHVQPQTNYFLKPYICRNIRKTCQNCNRKLKAQFNNIFMLLWANNNLFVQHFSDKTTTHYLHGEREI